MHLNHFRKVHDMVEIVRCVHNYTELGHEMVRKIHEMQNTGDNATDQEIF